MVSHSDMNLTTFSGMEVETLDSELFVNEPAVEDKNVSFWNGLGLVVGMMIGSGLFSSPGPVLESTGGYGTALIVWFVSGLLAFSGALCYAELGAMLPMNGGESVYLGRAYGRSVSFMFEFVTIAVQKPGSLAIICLVFGDYVSRVVNGPLYLPKILAVTCLWSLTIINSVSVKAGIQVQNALTAIKVLTAVAISAIGIFVIFSKSEPDNSFQDDPFGKSIDFGQLAVAFYSGLWAYDGWNNLNYVSGEMKNPHKDLPRVLYVGLPIVIVCYMLANIAYLAVLPTDTVMHSTAISIDFGERIFGKMGGILFSICVALSCFGSANASVFTGARIICVSAKQGHVPRCFGQLDQVRQTPMLALLLQATLTMIMILIGSFRKLVNFYSLSAWIFYFLAVLSVLVFRYTEPDLERPYRVWISTPVLFCFVALFLCTMPFFEAPVESIIASVFVAAPVAYIRLVSKNTTRGYQEMEMTETA